MKTIAIIGGGAAGLAAAVSAGRVLCDAGVPAGDVAVVIYEADERVGRSILATGNGRCNFSNALPDPSVYRNADFVQAVFSGLGEGAAVPWLREAAANPVHAFFSDYGLVWREEAQGRLYPTTNKASTVLDILRAAARSYGVEERCESAVAAIEPPRGPDAGATDSAPSRWTLRMADGVFQRADAVIVAAGGKAVMRMVPDAVRTYPLRPVLGPLKTDSSLTKMLDNIRVRAAVSLYDPQGNEKACEQGEVLFRKYGVSGIAVFNVSRFAQEGDVLSINLLPFVAAGESSDDVACGRFDAGGRSRFADRQGAVRAACGFLRGRCEGLARHGLAATCGDALRGVVLPLVAEAAAKAAGVSLSDKPSAGNLDRLAGALASFELEVEGIADPRQCQVHRGGIAVDAVDAQTMAVGRGIASDGVVSNAAPLPAGLYAAGEIIDVDAPCGGYNLHWAWASGLIAGASAARFVTAC